MNVRTQYKGVFRIAGLLFAFLFFTVIAGAQDWNTRTGRSEMTSLKKLVLGLDNGENNCHLERKCLEKIDFEMYVEREILIERWMHDRDFWIHKARETKDKPAQEEKRYRDGVWELLESDLGLMEKPEEDPEIELASWMYAKEFIQNVSSESSSQLETWMMDRSYWAMKK